MLAPSRVTQVKSSFGKRDGDIGRQPGIVFHQCDVGFQAPPASQFHNARQKERRHRLAGHVGAFGLALRLGAWWWFVPPGLLLALFGAALSLINFSIDEVINPKLRSQTRADRKKWSMSREQLKDAAEVIV